MATAPLLDTSAAVERLRAGQIIAYPTEAVYGLGCDPSNESAVRRLLALKGRSESAGFVLIASDFSQLEPWIRKTEQSLLDQAMQTWPGPVTWLFPRSNAVQNYVAGDHATIAVRITAHQPSRQLCEAFGSALISSSANQAAAEPARSSDEVGNYFTGELGGILEGALGSAQRPSEIRDLVSGRIIRKG